MKKKEKGGMWRSGFIACNIHNRACIG